LLNAQIIGVVAVQIDLVGVAVILPRQPTSEEGGEGKKRERKRERERERERVE
jgi:hypothetical protein